MMEAKALVFSHFNRPSYIGILIVIVVWLLGNVIFNEFRKHLSFYRRFAKLNLTVMIFYVTGLLFGQVVFYSLLGVMVLSQVIMHAWFYPSIGINGLTAEPRDKYYDFIGRPRRLK